MRMINEEIIITEEKEIRHNDLLFYSENPRIYSILHRTNGDAPSQDEIFKVLSQMDHVKDLCKKIKKNGGLVEQPIVKQDTYEVIEGNSRLAAWRLLADEKPLKWNKINCELLPIDISDEQITSLLVEFHIEGKTAWKPYEQAGYLWRLHNKDQISIKELSNQFGLGSGKLNDYITAFQFMKDHQQLEPEKWSYWYEYVKSTFITKARKKHNELDQVILEKVNSGEINKATMIRDDLPNIIRAPKNLVGKLIRKKSNFHRTVEEVKESGSDKATYKKLEDFKRWLNKNTQTLRNTTGKESKQIIHDLTLIENNASRIIKFLDKKIKKSS